MRARGLAFLLVSGYPKRLSTIPEVISPYISSYRRMPKEHAN